MSSDTYSHEKTMALLLVTTIDRMTTTVKAATTNEDIQNALDAAVYLEKKAVELRIHLEKMHNDPDYMNHALGLLALARSAYEQHLGTGESLTDQGVLDEPWKEANGGRAYVSAEDRTNNRKD